MPKILMPLGDGNGRVGQVLGGMDINIPQSELSKLDGVRRDSLRRHS